MSCPTPRRAMPLPLSRSIRHPVLWMALLAATATAGCAAWRVNTSKELAKASEPFQVSPASATTSLLVIGDSTAVGTGASDGRHSLPGLVATLHPQLRVVNKAADGARYAEFARQLEGVSDNFDIVLVLGGGNDVIRLTNADKLRSDVHRVAELARERGKRVILMPPRKRGQCAVLLSAAFLVDGPSLAAAAPRGAGSGSGNRRPLRWNVQGR